MCSKENDITLLFSGIENKSQVDVVARRGARLLDEVERSGARRVQTARAWPRAAQHKKLVQLGSNFYSPLDNYFFYKTILRIPQ